MERKSRRLSYILRHHPESIGIKLDEHAYGDVQKILEALNITIEDLDMIVREDEKQRYSYNGDHTRIRANQGHSIPVNVDLKEVQPPDILYHGTATRFVPSILEEGILSQARIYVHLSQDIETATRLVQDMGNHMSLLLILNRCMKMDTSSISQKTISILQRLYLQNT